jgi:membrane-associated phospholipid phosphatase
VTSLDASPRPLHWYERLGSAALVYALYFGGYGLVNRGLALDHCTDLTLPFDRFVPFVPAWVVPFYLAYLLVLLPALLVTTRHLMRHALIAFSLLVLGSCLIFVAFPTYVPRPALVPSGLSERLVASIYEHDRPCCAFPSLHVSASALSALVLGRQTPSYGWLLWPCVAAVAVSTLCIRQHVMLDAFGGLALAYGIEWVAWRCRAQRNV